MLDYCHLQTKNSNYMNTNSNSFKGVQALRGLAALSVMLFHFRWNINAVQPNMGDKLLGWGAVGVDLFFLISGFVITLSILRIEKSLAGTVSFLKKRALRILPAYYFWLLITFLLCGAMSIFHYVEKTENLISAILFTPIYPDHAPFFVDDSGNYGIRWTLNYEVYFYLVVGLAISFSRRWLVAGTYFLLTLIVLPKLLTGTFTLDPYAYKTGSALIGLIVNPMIFLFITGAIIGLALPCLQRLPYQPMIFLACVSFFLCAYYFGKGKFIGHGLMSSGWLLTLLLLFVVLSEQFWSKYIPVALMRLGDISYSLYLIHTILNFGMADRLQRLGLQPGWVMFVVFIAISVCLAVISWRFIELPFQKSKTSNKQTKMENSSLSN